MNRRQNVQPAKGPPKMHPIRLLRETLDQHDAYRWCATQAGLARFLDRSETLIRGVEKGRIPMSRKLARYISAKLGVSEDCLMQKEVEDDGMRIRKQLESFLKTDVANPIGTPGLDEAEYQLPRSPIPPRPAIPVPRRAPAQKAPARLSPELVAIKHNPKSRIIASIKRIIIREMRGLKAEEMLEFVADLNDWLDDRREERRKTGGNNSVPWENEEFLDELIHD